MYRSRGAILMLCFILVLIFIKSAESSNVGLVRAKCGNKPAIGEWFYDISTDSCFLVSERSSSWNEARNTCLSINSHLARIEAANYQFVKSILRRSVTVLTSEPNQRFWIGLTLENPISMTHKWEDGNLNNIFRAWDNNEPNPQRTQACTIMLATNGKWQDDYCQRSPGYRFLCRKSKYRVTPVNPQANISMQIKESWGCPAKCKNCVEYGASCYYISPKNDLKTWDEAKNACLAIYYHSEASRRSDLASIHSEHEQNFVMAHLGADRAHRWIGLHEDIDRQTLYWSDQTQVDYRNFNLREPMLSSKPECVMMYGDPGRAGRWNDEQCEAKAGYICKVAKDPSFIKSVQESIVSQSDCPNGFKSLSGTCFAIFPVPMHTNPDSVCARNFESKMASLTTPYENAFVFSMLVKHMDFRSDFKEEAILGGAVADRKIQWRDGCYVGYNRVYHSYEPEEELESACIAMDFEGDWMSRRCDTQHEFVVCQIRNTTNCQRQSVSNNGTCPPEFEDSCGDFCYQLSLDTPPSRLNLKPNTFMQAQLACLAMNGSLASIRNEQDKKCLDAILEKSVTGLWLGLYMDKFAGIYGNETRWKWMDPDAQVDANFVDWDEGEPSRSNETSLQEYCVELQKNGKWSSIECDALTELNYVCEKKKTPLPEPSTQKPATSVPVSSTPEMSTNLSAEFKVKQSPASTPNAKFSSIGAIVGWTFFGIILMGITVGGLFILWKRKSLPFNRWRDENDTTPFSRLTEDDVEHHL